MDWQQAASLLIVIATALLFARNALRKKKNPSSVSSSCAHCAGCGTGPSEIYK
ncbi:MAG: FeoB-associated Cys-rich membrane protein [Acidobacteriota bacterium]